MTFLWFLSTQCNFWWFFNLFRFPSRKREKTTGCLSVESLWMLTLYWLIVTVLWDSRPSTSHNKIRTSFLAQPSLAAYLSHYQPRNFLGQQSTQINCHLISFPGFVVADVFVLWPEINKLSVCSNVFWSSTLLGLSSCGHRLLV